VALLHPRASYRSRLAEVLRGAGYGVEEPGDAVDEWVTGAGSRAVLTAHPPLHARFSPRALLALRGDLVVLAFLHRTTAAAYRRALLDGAHAAVADAAPAKDVLECLFLSLQGTVPLPLPVVRALVRYEERLPRRPRVPVGPDQIRLLRQTSAGVPFLVIAAEEGRQEAEVRREYAELVDALGAATADEAMMRAVGLGLPGSVGPAPRTRPRA